MRLLSLVPADADNRDAAQPTDPAIPKDKRSLHMTGTLAPTLIIVSGVPPHVSGGLGWWLNASP